MEECYKCHTPAIHTVLFDVVLPTKIEKVCIDCAPYESYPIFKDAAFSEKKEKYPSVRERLMKMSGLAEEKKQGGFDIPQEQPSNLKEIIKAAASKPINENAELKKDLVDHFDWVVMRARRNKHLTKDQLAEEINEPFDVIESIEAGNAPSKREVIHKLENRLGVKLRKDDDAAYPPERKTFELNIKESDI